MKYQIHYLNKTEFLPNVELIGYRGKKNQVFKLDDQPCDCGDCICDDCVDGDLINCDCDCDCDCICDECNDGYDDDCNCSDCNCDCSW